jgi:hypothetical protein
MLEASVIANKPQSHVSIRAKARHRRPWEDWWMTRSHMTGIECHVTSLTTLFHKTDNRFHEGLSAFSPHAPKPQKKSKGVGLV